MKNTVRVGIIGIGNIGSVHAKKIFEGKVDGMTLSALCDNDPKRIAVLREQFCDIDVYSSHTELIESGKVDAVIISTPHYDHPPIAIDAFRHGLHVLSEKPIGVYCSAAKEMITAAEESGKLLAIMFNQRTNKLYRKAKELVESGEIGEIRRSVWIVTNWYRKQAYYDSGNWRATFAGEGGGVLMNQAPHNLDLWQWICGKPKKIYSVCPLGKYHSIEVEDDATIYAEFENGASGVFITSTGEYPGTNRLEIVGSAGKLVIENGRLTLAKLEMDEREYNLTEDSFKNKISLTEIDDEPYNGHIEILKNFASAILYGDKLIANGYDGLDQLSICNAAYLSSHLESAVSLPIDDNDYLDLLKKRIDSSKKNCNRLKSETHTFEYKDRWNTNW